jgi:hypothetical protein
MHFYAEEIYVRMAPAQSLPVVSVHAEADL